MSDGIIPTEVNLEESEFELVEARASALGISVDEFIRRAVREMLPAREEGLWIQHSGFAESGNPHASQTVDDFVYGSAD